jgi:hypothetical protein
MKGANNGCQYALQFFFSLCIKLVIHNNIKWRKGRSKVGICKTIEIVLGPLRGRRIILI